MKLATKIVIGVMLAGTIEAIIMLFVPANPSWQGSWALYHIPLGITAAYSWLYIGAATLFLMGLGVYRDKLRHAYLFIVSGIFLSSLGAAQMPIIAGSNLWQSWWVLSGAYSVLFVLGSILIYIGVRSFAYLVHTKTIFAKVAFVLPVIAGIGALSMLLPHIATSTPEITYDVANVIVLSSALTYLAAGLTTIAIRQHAGAHYANSLNWLAAGCVTGFIVLLTSTLDSLILDSAPDIWNLLNNLLALSAGLIFLRAGYLFYETREY